MRRICLFIVLVLMGTGIAQAEETCGTLSQADCTVLIEARESISELESAAFNLEFEVMYRDVLSFDEQRLRVIINGAYVLDEASSSVNSIGSLIRNMNANTSVIVEPDGDWPLIAEDADDVLTFEMRLVDGVGYLNVDKLVGANAFDPQGSGWYGIELANFLDLAFDDTVLDLFVSTAELDPIMEFGETTRREIDSTSENLVAFRTEVDLNDFLSDRQIRQFLRQQVYDGLLGRGSGMLYSDEELNDSVDAYLEIVEAVEIDQQQVVRVDDGALRHFEFSIMYRPDPALLLELFEGADPLNFAEIGAFELSSDLTVDFTRFNDVAATELPQDAIILPFNEILGQLLPGSPL